MTGSASSDSEKHMEPKVTPEQAVEDFLTERRGEDSQASHRNYKYALNKLVRFCEDNDIEHVGDLHGYHLKKFNNSDEYTSDDFLTLDRIYKFEYATMKLGFA